MSAEAINTDPVAAPRLVIFYAERSGKSRRVEGYLSQVLQRRRNHEAFRLRRVEVTQHPELVQRFGVDEVPTLIVVDGNRVSGRLVAPQGCREIERLLGPWLR